MARGPLTVLGRALGYVRVSTDKQELGLEAQEREIRELAKRKDLVVDQVFVDKDVSGKTPIDQRPGLTAALAALKRGTTLIAAKRDRFARAPEIMIALGAHIRRKGAVLATADGATIGDDPAGELLAGMVDVISRFERRLTGSRTSAALRAKQSAGGKAGGKPPFGWQIVGAVLTSRKDKDGKEKQVWVGGELQPHPEEQSTLAVVRGLAADGMSHRKIAEHLQASGHPPRGQRWHATTVARMLNEHDGSPSCS